jgi:hypothetical protein
MGLIVSRRIAEQGSVGRSLLVPVFVCLLLAGTVMAGCSDTTSSTTTTVTTSTTAPSTTEDTSAFGRVQNFLNEVAPSMGVEPRFALSRLRVTPDFEAQFVETFRTASVAEGLNVDLGIWNDDQLLYLGYLYCVGLDAGVTADESVTVVVATVATSQGRAPEAATNADAAVGVAAARYAGGSICGEYRLATEDLLVRLGGSPTTP